MVLRAPLVALEDAEGAAEEVEEEPAVLWARALAELAAALRALVRHARSVGLEGDEVEEAEDAVLAPVGDTEVGPAVSPGCRVGPGDAPARRGAQEHGDF
jgi:hypothetical protein